MRPSPEVEGRTTERSREYADVMMYKRVDELEPGDRLAQTLRHPKTSLTLITPHFVLDAKSLPRVKENLKAAGYHSVLVYNPALVVLERFYEEERIEAYAQLYRALANQIESTDKFVLNAQSIAETSKAISSLCQALQRSQFATAFVEPLLEGNDDVSVWRAISAERCYLSLTLAMEVKALALEDINSSVRDVSHSVVTDLAYDELGLGAMFIDVQDQFGEERTAEVMNELERHPIARAVIRQRNQRFDGRGTSSRPGHVTEVVLRGRAIHPYTRIAQIAAAYARLHLMGTGAPEEQGRGLIPARCLWLMATDAELSGAFDPDYLASFLGLMQPYPIGHRVTLSTGESGVVMDWRREAPWRPTVRVLEREGRPIPEPYDLDLVEARDVGVARYENAPDDCLQYVY